MFFPTTRTTLLRNLDGDEAAWQDFFVRYRSAVADLGHFKGLTEEECGELVQNVMIRFHRKIEAGFRYDRKLARFRTFFSALIRGCIYDLLRRRHQALSLEEIPELSGGDPPDELLDMALLEKWRTILKEEAFALLAQRVDEKTFQAFDLYAVKGCPVKQTAALLDLTPNQIYVAKSRCLAHLRDIIAQLNADDPELNLHV